MEFTAELYLIIVIVYTFPIHCYDLISLYKDNLHTLCRDISLFKTTLLQYILLWAGLIDDVQMKYDRMLRAGLQSPLIKML